MVKNQYAHHLRIRAGFLSQCTPHVAYEWLSLKEANSTFQDPIKIASLLEREEKKILEYLLLRRNDLLIDLGLAQYGSNPMVLRRLYSRGGAGIKCAILSNQYLYDIMREPVIPLKKVVQDGHRSELAALAANPHLPDKFYEEILTKTGEFEDLKDKDFMFMIGCLGGNKRMSTSYESNYLDGWAEYSYNKVFKSAWQLALTVPTSQSWAFVLYALLRNTHLPVTMDDIDVAINRWRIDREKKDDEKFYNAGWSFDLRSRLADLLQPTEELRDSGDQALKKSFCRRFSPVKYPDWVEYMKEKQDVEEVIFRNTYVWSDSVERGKLNRLVWELPDPTSMMDLPNSYRSAEEYHKQHHPEFFENA